MINLKMNKVENTKIPISVNYHFTRKCNLKCGFCFHTSKTSYILSPEEAKRGLKLLKNAGMKKINFAGGEPFLYKPFLGELIKYCKEDLKIEKLSIITNGTLVTENFLKTYHKFIDVLGVSCDSFNEETNKKIGRGTGRNVEKLFEISRLCEKYNIKFKLNSVICSLNFEEDMNENIIKLNPFRWKCFQVLLVQGENEDEKRLRDVRKFQISNEDFELFCNRHKNIKCFIPESNNNMKSSYLILDEYMRFLDKGDGEEKASESILDVGVKKALENIRWDEDAFKERKGDYLFNDNNSCQDNCELIKAADF
jgi:radical S-adenosyl methionine domain-containing protein 2